MVLMLLTEQTGEMFGSLLQTQNHHSATDNAETRICFCYYPADAGCKKMLTANDETHMISIGLTQQSYTPAIMQDKTGEEFPKRK